MNEDEMKKKVIKQAEEKMPNFDTIIDLFDMSFVYISKESAQLSGFNPNEMIGKSIHEFMSIPSSDGESFQNIIMKTIAGGIVKIPIKAKGGKQIDVPMNFISVEVNNHPFIVTKAVQNK